MSYNRFILFISIAYRRIDGFGRMTAWNRQGIPFTGRIDSKRHSLFPVLSVLSGQTDFGFFGSAASESGSLSEPS